MFQSGILMAGRDGELCGNFQQSDDAAELAALADVLQGVEELAQVLDADAASALLGFVQSRAGYWYPRSGWLHPPAVCRALLQRDNIQVREQCGPISLQREGERWHAVAGGRSIASAPCAIAAAGTGTTHLEPLHWLPLHTIRGQTTLLPSADAWSTLRATLCHEGFIAPARGGYHCIGATFEVGATDAKPRDLDNRDNLQKLAAAVPAWQETLQALDPAALQSRVGFRCASPDYLPVVGPAPDHAAFLADYAGLRNNARLASERRGQYLPGLYLSTAHGSRGLTSTPLAAQILASMICAEPLPLSRALSRALSPARFIIRGLIRNRI
jgi:tRNA 5-methylaminomethyl-2-thiouridine biosynthesis bifunctional protein